jgi:hypothetical protein
VETVATAFTDHFAVTVRLATDVPILLYDRAFWESLQERWIKWHTHKRYQNAVMWWTRYVKAQLKKLFVGEGIARRQG